MSEHISRDDVAAFLARYDGIEVPDWRTGADLSRMGMESMVKQQAAVATSQPTTAQDGQSGTGTPPRKPGASEGDE